MERTGDLLVLHSRWMRAAAAAVTVALLVGFGPAVARAGEIDGTVTIRSHVAPRAMGRRHEAPSRRDGGDTDGGYGGYGGSPDDALPPAPLSRSQEARFVVLYLVPVHGSLKSAPGVAYMRQHHKEFVPHVLPVVRGSVVVFANDDHILHNIYSPTEPGAFEIPKYGYGASTRIRMEHRGPLALFCGIHSRMNGYVFVVDNNCFAMPDARRRYVIRNVPPGSYWLRAWHPRVAREAVQRVDVPAAGTVHVDVTL